MNKRREPLRVKPLTPKMIAKYESEYAFSKTMLAWADACRGQDDEQEIRELKAELERQNKFPIGGDPVLARRLEILQDSNRAICAEANFTFNLKRK